MPQKFPCLPRSDSHLPDFVPSERCPRQRRYWQNRHPVDQHHTRDQCPVSADQRSINEIHKTGKLARITLSPAQLFDNSLAPKIPLPSTYQGPWPSALSWFPTNPHRLTQQTPPSIRPKGPKNTKMRAKFTPLLVSQEHRNRTRHRRIHGAGKIAKPPPKEDEAPGDIGKTPCLLTNSGSLAQPSPAPCQGGEMTLNRDTTLGIIRRLVWQVR